VLRQSRSEDLICAFFVYWSVSVSLDKTLKIRLGSSRTRNVLTRGERIARLQEEDRFAAGRSPLGLPKVRVQKALSGKKKKKTAEEGAAAATPAPAKGKK
jgi:small basic protein (TIGR04137 family)